MAPYEIRDETLKVLRRMRTVMQTAPWVLALRRQDEATRQRAAMLALRVQAAILDLENTSLASIRDDLLANEASLKAGREQVDEALEELDRTRHLLRVGGELLGVLGRIVTLL